MLNNIEIEIDNGFPIEVELTFPQGPPLYLELNNPITQVIDISFANIGPQGPPGAGADEVKGETPAGIIDGSNATFTSLFPFVPESVALFVNGLRQKIIQDYNTSGNQTIICGVSPGLIDTLLIDYQKT